MARVITQGDAKATFIVMLHQLEIMEDLGIGDKINDNLRITNNRQTISDLIDLRSLSIIGELEGDSLLAGQVVIYAKTEIPNDVSPQQFLVSLLYQVKTFLMTIWLIQDNCINCELGFLIYKKNGIQQVSSNFIAQLYLDSCGGKLIETRLTREQLREIRSLHRSAIATPDHNFVLPISQLASSYSRFERAMYFVNSARGERDMGIRVAHYCTALETLFATSQSELTHQLSERVSCFLFQNLDDRLLTYRKIKKAYLLRSKVVHGSTLSDNNIKESIDTSIYCDQIVRKLLYRILTEPDCYSIFELDPKSFDEAMLKCIFVGALSDDTGAESIG